MSLEKWLENAWLRKEPTSPQEIQDLRGVVDRSLKDASVDQISEDLRFYTAFNAVLALSTIALRSIGYRVPNQVGHHTRTIESLEFTVEADPALIRKLLLFSKKRNMVSYDSAGSISHEELKQILHTSNELREVVYDWLLNNHPQLSTSS